MTDKTLREQIDTGTAAERAHLKATRTSSCCCLFEVTEDGFQTDNLIKSCLFHKNREQRIRAECMEKAVAAMKEHIRAPGFCSVEVAAFNEAIADGLEIAIRKALGDK